MSISAPIGSGPKIDLYDLFSVLLPGSGFILGLYPFLPKQTNLTGPASVLLLLVVGYIVGRGLHAFAIRMEQVFDIAGHRDLFIRELRQPTIVPAEIVDRFYTECQLAFGNLGFEGSRYAYLENPQVFGYLYPFVRGYIHADSRARCRTFQAVHAFFRSAEYGAILLASIYIMYAFVVIIVHPEGAASGEILPYETKLATLQLQPTIIEFIALASSFIAVQIFEQAKYTYRDLYVEYLIADFIMLRQNIE